MQLSEGLASLGNLGGPIEVPLKPLVPSQYYRIKEGPQLGPNGAERHQPLGQPMRVFPVVRINEAIKCLLPIHSQIRISDSFQIKRNMIVVSVFLSILNTNALPLGSKSKGKLSLQSFSVRLERNCESVLASVTISQFIFQSRIRVQSRTERDSRLLLI